MLNYNIDAAILKPRVPRGTELDITDYGALVSLVGFRFLNTRLTVIITTITKRTVFSE